MGKPGNIDHDTYDLWDTVEKTPPTRDTVGTIGTSGQVKSAKRVADYGEVFTAPREVNAMLDLVDGECHRVESLFLEPACGEGAFLREVLRRKLSVVRDMCLDARDAYTREAVIALCSLYGIELLKDNVDICRERLYQLWIGEYKSFKGEDAAPELSRAIRYILSLNIVCADTIGKDPIYFSQWTISPDMLVSREVYSLDSLIEQGTRDIDTGGAKVAPVPLLMLGL